MVYWYHARTEWLLTQPVGRFEILAARWCALTLALTTTLGVGLLTPFLVTASWDSGLVLLTASSTFLTIVFVTVGIGIATVFSDRVRGIGAALALWFYFALIHDALILLVLLAFKEYPLDGVAAILGSLNPIGLVRVAHILKADAAMLLSYTGALSRNLMTGWQGPTLAAVVCLAWLVGPAFVAIRRFARKDF